MKFDPEIWKRLPAELRAEISENVMRKDWTPSELDGAGRRIEPYIAEAAKERQREGGRRKAGGKLPPAEKYKTRDLVAGLLGTSGRNLEKIGDVVEAAESDPEQFGPLVDEMNRRGTVHNAHRRLLILRDRERVAGLQPIVGRFRTLVIDPPWEYDDGLAGQSRPDYATMTLEKLRELPVCEWAEDDSHCYLWTTNGMLPHAFELMKSFGFEYKTTITWLKTHSGLGRYFRNRTEHILFGVRGRLSALGNHNNVIEAPVRSKLHSEKPEQFYQLVRDASPPNYGEAFQRKVRPDFVNLFEKKKRR